jgi:plastocyanin
VEGRVTVLEKGGRVSTNAGATLAYIDGLQAAVTPSAVTIQMRHKTFVPRIVAVVVGSTVHFPNLDPIHHNVFSVSRGNRFDLDLYKRPGSRSATLTQAGIVRVYCNIHPQMTAIVLVRDNPYFAWVAPDGTFVLENVPAGRHRVTVWNDRSPEVSADVVVPESGRVRVELTLDASRYRPAPHKNKYGQDYRSDDRY